MYLKVNFTASRADSPTGIYQVIDDTTIFVAVDSIRVNVVDKPGEIVDVWDAAQTPLADCRSYVNVEDGDTGERCYDLNVKLVEAVLNDVSKWFLVTRAWLLGEGGQTIERIAP